MIKWLNDHNLFEEVDRNIGINAVQDHARVIEAPTAISKGDCELDNDYLLKSKTAEYTLYQEIKQGKTWM